MLVLLWCPLPVLSTRWFYKKEKKEVKWVNKWSSWEQRSLRWQVRHRLERFPELKRRGSCDDLIWATSSLSEDTHAHTQTQTHIQTHTQRHTQTHKHTHTDTHTQTHRHTHRHTDIHTHTETHTDTHRDTCRDTYPDTHTHTHTQTHTHTHTRVCAWSTHTHTHTHTHGFVPEAHTMNPESWGHSCQGKPCATRAQPPWQETCLVHRQGTGKGMPQVLTWKPKLQVDQRDLISSSLELINSEDRSFPNPVDDLVRWAVQKEGFGVGRERNKDF